MSKAGYEQKFWGSDLTSTAGFDSLIKRMEDGKSTCKSLEQFFRLRSKCDEDYSKALIKISKGMLELTEEGTINDAWRCMKLETEEMGKIHMEASQHYTDLASKLSAFQKNLKTTRKPKEDKVSALSKEKTYFYKKIMEAKRLYEQRSMESDTADAALKKAKVNENSFTTKEWDKIVSKSSKALQDRNKSEMAYKDTALKLEEVRIDWQKEHLQFCQLCENQDEERLKALTHLMWEATNVTSVSCVDDDKLVELTRKSLEKVKIDNDMALFVACNQTGCDHPGAVKFEVYRGGETCVNQASNKHLNTRREGGLGRMF